jgi:Ca2+-binding EF-hand superfamily protein
MRDQLQQLEVDADALDAISQAQALQAAAKANAAAYSELIFEVQTRKESDDITTVSAGRVSPGGSARGSSAVASARAGSGEAASVRSGGAPSVASSRSPSKTSKVSKLSRRSEERGEDQTPERSVLIKTGSTASVGSVAGSVKSAPKQDAAIGRAPQIRDGAIERAQQRQMEREMELDKQREDLVKQAMVMLNAWKSHSQVAIALCDALLKMAEVGGDEALKEMEKRGLGVLASTVADLHSDRCEVARCALRLLSKVSIELLLLTVEEQRNSNTMVGLGLEALNRRVKNDQKKLDELAKYGGRELLDGLEVEWKGSRMISLHILNLRRRLRRSTTKSIKKIYEVQLPPEDVVILRETFDAVDPEKTGSVDKVQFGEAMKILRIQFSEDDIEEAIREVDLDGSGMLDWPEFLFFMNRFGSNFSIENKFTEERLKEMRQVFEMFDADNSGTLDIGELRDVMHSIGLAPEEWEIRAMIAEVDDDNSGEIEWAEFLYLMSKKTVDAENQSRLAFEYFLEKNDTSGKIWKNRFVEQMQKLTSEFTRQELEAMLVQAKCEDMDTSYMTYKEFVKMMMTV